MTQLSIFDMAVTVLSEYKDKPAKELTLEERWSAFVAANPLVMTEMLRLARIYLERGATFISVKRLWEELRVELQTKHGAQGEYKLNNSFTALAARMLLEMDPRLIGVIRTRKRTSL